MSGSTCLAVYPAGRGRREPRPGRARGRARAELRIYALSSRLKVPLNMLYQVVQVPGAGYLPRL